MKGRSPRRCAAERRFDGLAAGGRANSEMASSEWGLGTIPYFAIRYSPFADIACKIVMRRPQRDQSRMWRRKS
jgi:hypothetical protein